MTVRIVLITQAPTAALRSGDFPADDPLDEGGRKQAATHSLSIHAATRLRTAATQACRETAELLGLAAAPAPELDDWDLGRWRGAPSTSVAPEDLQTWLNSPAAAPHGGESLVGLLGRIGGWLQLQPDGSTVAVTSAAVARAAIVTALDTGPGTFWRIDLAPLTAAVLTGDGRRWNLRASGQPLDSLPMLTR